MNHDQAIAYALVTLLVGVVLTFFLTRWRNSKGRTSVHAADTDMEDIAFSAISSAFSIKPVTRVDGFTEVRPTWGIRLLAPLMALGVLIWFDFAGWFTEAGFTWPWFLPVFYGVSWIALLYTWASLLFIQRVVYDDSIVESYGVDLTKNVRRLNDLVDIHVHEKRPALVLTFADQRPLYIPKFLSGRDSFISRMQKVANANLAAGYKIPKASLANRLGF